VSSEKLEDRVRYPQPNASASWASVGIRVDYDRGRRHEVADLYAPVWFALFFRYQADSNDRMLRDKLFRAGGFSLLYLVDALYTRGAVVKDQLLQDRRHLFAFVQMLEQHAKRSKEVNSLFFPLKI
jgi:hypothetical protein